MTTDQEVNPGSRVKGVDTISVIVPFSPEDHARIQAACDVVTRERGEIYTFHNLLCDAVSLAVQDIERGVTDDAGDDGTDQDGAEDGDAP